MVNEETKRKLNLGEAVAGLEMQQSGLSPTAQTVSCTSCLSS